MKNSDKYYLPTAEELRKYQDAVRLNVINKIKDNANKGYYGCTILEREGEVTEALAEELKAAGYEVTFNLGSVHIKWGKNK